MPQVSKQKHEDVREEIDEKGKEENNEEKNKPTIKEQSENIGKQPATEIVVVEKPCEKNGGVTNKDKWIIAIIIGILVFIIFSTFFFRLTNYLFKGFGLPTCDATGKPTLAGLVIHSVFLVILVRILMH